MRLDILCALLFNFPHPLTVGPRILLVEDGINAARHVSLFEVVDLVLVAARDLLRYHLSDLVEVRVHCLIVFLGAFCPFADGRAPVLVVFVLAWRRYRLLPLRDFLRASHARVITQLTFGPAVTGVDIALHPAGVLRRFVSAWTWDLLLLLCVLFEEGQVFHLITNRIALLGFQPSARGLALRRDIRLHGEVRLVLMSAHVSQAQGVTWPLNFAIAGAAAHLPCLPYLVRSLLSESIEIHFLPMILCLRQFSLRDW